MFKGKETMLKTGFRILNITDKTSPPRRKPDMPPVTLTPSKIRVRK